MSTSTEEISTTEPTLISNLNIYEDEWVIKVKVLRRGSILPFTNSKGSGQIWKIILIDEEGTKIQAVMFNNAVEKFIDVLWNDKTYLISNASIKPVNNNYAEFSVNKEKEITISVNSNIIESENSISIHDTSYSFISFKDAIAKEKSNERFDVIGFVTSVKPLYTLKKNEGLKKNGEVKISFLREILIKDTKLNCLRIMLWDDLAENEGRLLENMVSLNETLPSVYPIVAFSGIKASRYQGEINLTTQTISTLQINPDWEITKPMREWLQTFLDGANVEQLTSTIKRIKNAPEVKLNDIMKGNVSNSNGLYCYFKAVVENVLDRDSLWYEACKVCNKKVDIVEDGARCYECNETKTTYNQRYRVKLKVADDRDRAIITLFDEAKNLTGCPISQFIASKQQKNLQCKFYRRLINCTGKRFKFLIRMSKSHGEERSMGRMVADEVEQIEDSDTESNEEQDNEKQNQKKKKRSSI